MRYVPRPIFSHSQVFNACLLGTGDAGVRSRCESIAVAMTLHERRYNALASSGTLAIVDSHERGGDLIPVSNNATRGDLKGLYTKQMAKLGKPARAFYDAIRMSSAGNVCPYCGIGVVETLDHFLPKGHYSLYSVMPCNLVPSCRDCNTGKLDGGDGLFHMSSHPYFEDERVRTDRWLLASVVQTNPAHAEFRFLAPITWSSDMSTRVLNHFESFELARRYSVQAAGRFSFYAELISNFRSGGDALLDGFLLQCANAEVRAYGVNSWQAALASSVASDSWFKAEGFQHFI